MKYHPTPYIESQITQVLGPLTQVVMDAKSAGVPEEAIKQAAQRLTEFVTIDEWLANLEAMGTE